jgi:hypothetical protein
VLHVVPHPEALAEVLLLRHAHLFLAVSVSAC